MPISRSKSSSRFSLPSLENPPSTISLVLDNEPLPKTMLPGAGSRERWEIGSTLVTLNWHEDGRVSIALEEPRKEVCHISLHWNLKFPDDTLFLGDAWERSYGDLEWLPLTASRLMPWYFLAAHAKRGTACYGVLTGAAAMACWQVDRDSMTLHLDVRSGGAGVRLGKRTLEVATLVTYHASSGRSPFSAAQEFSRTLCSSPRLPKQPVAGHNDWYWLYGKNSESLILDSTQRLVDLWPSTSSVRPWSVIDDGWQVLAAPDTPYNGGPWDRGGSRFPDMARLARKIKRMGARPGIWMRPLLTRATIPKSWQLRRNRPTGELGVILDPSVAEVVEQVQADVRRLVTWGYELIKHDFSTFDITGRWGFQMMPSPWGVTENGWRFSDSRRTTAEIIRDLYRAIREAVGPDVLVMGCNTVGHLAAGTVEIQRTGDDTSASDWDRTRRMGVNTLAFRAAQHGAFFAIDADCVPVSPIIPWQQTSQWLELVANSGTPLFVSLNPTSIGPKQTTALRKAFKKATQHRPVIEPMDWMTSRTPSYWQGTSCHYNWSQ